MIALAVLVIFISLPASDRAAPDPNPLTRESLVAESDEVTIRKVIAHIIQHRFGGNLDVQDLGKWRTIEPLPRAIWVATLGLDQLREEGLLRYYLEARRFPLRPQLEDLREALAQVGCRALADRLRGAVEVAARSGDACDAWNSYLADPPEERSAPPPPDPFQAIERALQARSRTCDGVRERAAFIRSNPDAMLAP